MIIVMVSIILNIFIINIFINTNNSISILIIINIFIIVYCHYLKNITSVEYIYII